jgi:hypothetical protein
MDGAVRSTNNAVRVFHDHFDPELETEVKVNYTSSELSIS